MEEWRALSLKKYTYVPKGNHELGRLPGPAAGGWRRGTGRPRPGTGRVPPRAGGRDRRPGGEIQKAQNGSDWGGKAVWRFGGEEGEITTLIAWGSTFVPPFVYRTGQRTCRPFHVPYVPTANCQRHADGGDCRRDCPPPPSGCGPAPLGSSSLRSRKDTMAPLLIPTLKSLTCGGIKGRNRLKVKKGAIENWGNFNEKCAAKGGKSDGSRGGRGAGLDNGPTPACAEHRSSPLLAKCSFRFCFIREHLLEGHRPSLWFWHPCPPLVDLGGVGRVPLGASTKTHAHTHAGLRL